MERNEGEGARLSYGPAPPIPRYERYLHHMNRPVHIRPSSKLATILKGFIFKRNPGAPYRYYELIMGARNYFLYNTCFDETNEAIVICNQSLREEFRLPGFHIMEFPDLLDVKLENIAYTTNWENAQALGMPPECGLEDEDALKAHGFTETQLFIEYNKGSIKLAFNDQTPYNLSNRSLYILQQLGGFETNDHICTVKEVLTFLCDHLVANFANYKVPDNHRLVSVHNTLIGEFLGVNCFHRIQLPHLIMRRLREDTMLELAPQR